jgi:NDP-sugar pyrophosphorylase family protein
MALHHEISHLYRSHFGGHRSMEVGTRQACILVGGRGTRLGALSLDVPKPLMPFGNDNVFLDFVIDQAVRQGFTDILLLAGHLAEVVEARYRQRTFHSAAVRVLVEPSPAGTGGALFHARDHLAPRFLLLNGDSYLQMDLRKMVMEAEDADRAALIALRRVGDAARYGMVDVDGSRIVRFREKALEQSGSALINAGIYVLRAADVLERIAGLPCSIETDILPELATAGELWGREEPGYFIDIGLPASLQRAREELPRVADGMSG